MAKSVRVFGYGSLMSRSSLLRTVPSAQCVEPAIVTGFDRSFSFWDPVGYTETNLDVRGLPMCALNITPSTDPNAVVSGITFLVDPSEMSALRQREVGYEEVVVPIIANSFAGHPMMGLTYSALPVEGTFQAGGLAQMRYLRDFLQAAAEYGPKFYNATVESTRVDGKVLREHLNTRSVVEDFEQTSHAFVDALNGTLDDNRIAA